MNDDLVLHQGPYLPPTPDDGAWTTTWTLTVTRVPDPQHPRPPQYLRHPTVEGRVVPGLPAPAAPALPATRRSAREDARRTAPRARERAPQARDRTPRPSGVPGLLPAALAVAIGIGVVTAGVRADALEGYGLSAPDNRTVVAHVRAMLDDVSPGG
jgi:hypothetical protein